MRKLVVGDIHGCWEEFRELLDRAALSDDDQVIALGDIVDRGPHSPAVLAQFQQNGQMCSLLGNHERKHLRWFGNELQPALSQRITRHQLGDRGHALACHYFSTLPAYLDLDEAWLVHGYLEPGLPLEKQHINVLTGTLSGAAYLEERYGGPWYEKWRSEKPVIVGHCDYSQKGVPTEIGAGIFSLDTNCCRGGALSGLLLPEFRFITVKARCNHYAALMEDFLDFRLEERKNEDLKWDRIERLLSLPSRRTRLSSSTMERLQELRALDRRCADLLFQIELRVQKLTAEALALMENGDDVKGRTEQDKGHLFSQIVGKTELSPFLHRARLGKFSTDDIRRYCSTPAKLESFAALVLTDIKN